MRCVNAKQAIEAINCLPELPGTYHRVVSVANNPGSGAADLASVVSADTSLAAQILHVANTPFYGMTGRIETVPRAVVVLGVKTVCSIALGQAVRTVIEDPISSEGCRIDVWKHSLQTAIAAQELAEYHGTIDPDVAFTGGLLHDMGKLALSTMFPDAYRKVLDDHAESCRPLTELEEDVFGLNHTAAGAILCSRWNLPGTIRRLVEGHHDINAPGSEASAVSNGNRLARLITPHASGEIYISLDELEVLFREKRRQEWLRRLVVSQAMQPPAATGLQEHRTLGVRISEKRIEQAIELIALACGYLPLYGKEADAARLVIACDNHSSCGRQFESIQAYLTEIGQQSYLNVAALHRLLLDERPEVHSPVATGESVPAVAGHDSGTDLWQP